ncbi:MAG: bifunctional (p)ppGpp synthetase/guanosine-3',5'-bis(diphosphate) 3'-pyrophosphohydrolase [Flavobacteriales bacterium]|jgi:guanosine-3',5'-bis(diphosphate) 3'-pyrophosphohydrolase|nr:bifunctional (p)ppGpp synthetase/guanosine-3',5'-bis(diphosphate) 3'-pyrophosphohydrolase [Flavobacteriales bacterium]
MVNIDTEKEDKEILNKYRNLLRACSDKTNKKDKKDIRAAFNLAVNAHKDIRRKSGEPYIYHPIAVAHIAAKEIGLGSTSIVCALLHDVVEDTDYEIEDIQRLFGPKVAIIIEGLTKISEVFNQDVSLQAENFRKMLLTLSDDVRVILIKLADRLHNMRTLDSMPVDKKKKISSETLYLYAPLAHRLGLYPIKTELEDLGLKHTKLEEYKEISQKLIDTKEDRTKYIRKFIRPIKSVLKEKEFSFEIKGRPKSIYSIRKKMTKQNVGFDNVFDKFAVRIIIDTPIEREKSDCWRIYSFVTDFYKPNPDRLRDWISTSKSNGYESLHTTVMGPEGKWVEVQIRTSRMDDIAEKGYAAHWKYKNKNTKESSLDDWITKIRELLENPETNAIDFIDDFKLNLFSSEIFIFTPEGDLKKLPKNATALDFAFEIHSEVGSHCLGAKVNGKLVPLSHILSSGDQVEIITSNKQKPKKDWIKFVVTSRAKSKIKSSLKEEKKEIAKNGKEIAERKLRYLKVKLDQKTETELIKFFNLHTSLDLYFRFGSNSILNSQIKEFVKAKNSGWYETIKRKIYKGSRVIVKGNTNTKIIVFGEDQEVLPYKLANCCNPIPGDRIFGFTTVEDGIKIHKDDCPNSIQLRSNYSYRILESSWVDREKIDFIATIHVKGIDRLGLINNVTKIISSQMNVNMRAININSDDGVFEGEITLFVHNVTVLNTLTEKLKNVDGVTKIKRIYKHT